MKDENEPMYYSRDQLAARVGISIRTFTTHLTLNVGNLNDAREVHPGIGIVYKASKCRKYIALCAAGTKAEAGRYRTRA